MISCSVDMSCNNVVTVEGILYIHFTFVCTESILFVVVIYTSFLFFRFSDMITFFKESYNPSPIPQLLDQIFDIKEWLAPVNA